MMRIEQILYFVETVNAGSLSCAAQKLKISQPALSISISNFEHELNIQLLIRSSQGITLTPKGKLVYNDCLYILETINSSYSLWKNQKVSTSPAYQNIHILCIPALVNSFNQIVTNISKITPHINLYIDIRRSQEQFSILKNNKVPICIGAFTSEEKTAKENLYLFAYQNNLIVEILFCDNSYLVLSSNNPLAKKDYIFKDEINDLALAYSSNPYDTTTLQSTINHFQTKNLYRFSTPDGIFEMVAQNEAVTIESGYAIRQTKYFQSGQICYRPIIDYDMKFYHYILHIPEECLNNNEIMVLNAIKDVLSF